MSLSDEFLPVRLTLTALTAEELMTPAPVTVPEAATLREAAGLLLDHEITAAPVVDPEGQPVGVLSRSDIVRFTQRELPSGPRAMEYYHVAELALDTGEVLKHGFHEDAPPRIPVREVMTPVVFTVAPDTPTQEVIQEMLRRRIHRLFVVDESGSLQGVISALDVLRHLKAAERTTS